MQNHCYRADEMLTMIDIAKEFGYKIAAFHHAVEAYKIADVLAANGICADIWADWWGFKMEAFDGIRENVALVAEGRRLRRSSTPTPPRASSGSTRRPPRPWPPATAWA